MRPELAAIVEEFAQAERGDLLEYLLDYANDLPELPERYRDGSHATMQQVEECQTPLFLAVELDDAARVRLFFDAPAEAPTTRAFAGILHTGLDGATPQEVLETPLEFAQQMGLSQAVSPLRMRGLSAMLGRIKALVAATTAG